jgi:hypothetical protein
VVIAPSISCTGATFCLLLIKPLSSQGGLSWSPQREFRQNDNRQQEVRKKEPRKAVMSSSSGCHPSICAADSYFWSVCPSGFLPVPVRVLKIPDSVPPPGGQSEARNHHNAVICSILLQITESYWVTLLSWGFSGDQ